MGTFTHEQKVFMALGRTIAGSLSFIASSIIVYKIYGRYKAGKAATASSSHRTNHEMTTYHRMLLGISIIDLIHSLGAIPGTTPVPASTGVVFGHGTTATCTAQAVVVQFALAVPIYVACLTTYFMLKIRYNVPDATIRCRYEPWFHAIPWIFAIVSSTLGAALKIFNPIQLPEMGCWVSPYPPGCSIRGGCTRGYKIGEYIDLYCWLWAHVWLWSSFLVVVVNSVLIYTAIRKQEQRNAGYLGARLQRLSMRQLQPQQHGAPLKNSIGNTVSTNSITTNTDRHVLDVSHTTSPEEAVFHLPSEGADKQPVKDDVDMEPAESNEDPSSNQDEFYLPSESVEKDAVMDDVDMEPTERNEDPSSNQYEHCLDVSQNNEPEVVPAAVRKSVKLSMKDGTVRESTSKAWREKFTRGSTALFSSSTNSGNVGGSSAHQQQRTSASKVAAVQCALYCTASFFTAIWIFFPWFGWKIGAPTNFRVVYTFGVCFISHFQGVFNLFIFVRLQYNKLRETEPEWSRFKCIMFCLTSPASSK